MYHQSNDAVITQNNITSYHNRGIFAYLIGSAQIVSNKIYGKSGNNSEDAIHITGDNSSKNVISIRKNYIKASSRYGIYGANIPKSYIGSNNIVNSIKNGVFLNGSSDNSRIYYNKVTNLGKSGNASSEIYVWDKNTIKLYKNILKH